MLDEATHYRDFFDDKEIVFYKNINDLSEKIVKVASDEKLRKKTSVIYGSSINSNYQGQGLKLSTE